MWVVMCRVSGGVTGTRTAVLKANGVVKNFATHDEAAAEAKRLDKAMNGPYAKAFFEYWPLPADDPGVGKFDFLGRVS